MQAETPDTARDTELGQLRADVGQLQATVSRQEALIETLLAKLEVQTASAVAPEPRPSKRSKRPLEAVSTSRPKCPPTSRRGLLKRLGTSAAGAAVAATALGAARPEQAAADAAVTVNGGSTNNYGVYASNNTITPRPAVPADVKAGVLGVSSVGANLNILASTQGSGVAGATFVATGVVGTASDQGLGVGGICIAETPRTLFNTSAGVAGVSTVRAGVSGISGNNHGVIGRTQAPAGTVVANDSQNPGGGMLAAGLAGRTSSTIALYGYADGPPNPNFAPVGAVGQCESGFGVWGLSSAGPGATSRPGGGAVTAVSGVLGTSASGLGVYAISSGSYALAADGNGPSTVGALIRGLGGAQAAVFVGNVEIQGHLTVTGGVNGPVGAQTTGSAPTSPALVEAMGRGQVERGTATVALDPTVAAQVQGADYDVFLTSYDNVHLHVAQRTSQGFEVRVTEGTGRAADIAAGRASAGFSYRVVARRRPGAGSQRADAAALHQPSIPVPQGVPTLPVGRETPPAAPSRKPDER
jgi:hypothetical protein